MTSQLTTQARSKPWVEWCANRIDDPMARLKFLRTVTPLALPAPPARRTFWKFAAALAILPAALGSLAAVRAATRGKTVAAVARPMPAQVAAAVSPTSPPPPVWLVDKSADSETYSNGLRIDKRFESANRPRAYLAFPADRPDAAGSLRTTPAGIVFHTTESRQLPFEASANSALKQVGESLIDYVRRKHAYHYLIDRFGRVFRIVPESDAADHAGYSVWRDDHWLYLNLNQSFLGVSFETKTEPGQEDPTISPAQTHSAAMLTEMLRARYGIPAGNCVTHAQVSVNPENMRVGLPYRLGVELPVRAIGLAG
jgi:hypothetical protein